MISLTACAGDEEHLEITVDEVQKIRFSSQKSEDKELTSDEIEAFVELYNKSEYDGEATGEGGTPYYGVTVYYKDGSSLQINDFHSIGHDFEVGFRYDDDKRFENSFYVNNQELTDYLEGFLEDDSKVSTGNYFAEGDYEKNETPYVHLDVEHNIFSFSHGTIFSAALNGKYEIVGDKLIATLSDDKTVEFEIADGKTLVLANGDVGIGNKKMSVGTRFKFRKELK